MGFIFLRGKIFMKVISRKTQKLPPRVKFPRLQYYSSKHYSLLSGAMTLALGSDLVAPHVMHLLLHYKLNILYYNIIIQFMPFILNLTCYWVVRWPWLWDELGREEAPRIVHFHPHHKVRTSEALEQPENDYVSCEVGWTADGLMWCRDYSNNMITSQQEA